MSSASTSPERSGDQRHLGAASRGTACPRGPTPGSDDRARWSRSPRGYPASSRSRHRMPGLTPSPSPNSGRHSTRRMRCCCSENFGVALSSPGTSVGPIGDRAGLRERDHGLPDADHVPVVEPPPARQAQPVDPGAVLRQAVVGHRPLPRPQLQLRVQPRALGVPRQRDVGLLAPAHRHGRAAGLHHEDALAAFVVAVDQERRPEALRCQPRLELRLAHGRIVRLLIPRPQNSDALDQRPRPEAAAAAHRHAARSPCRSARARAAAWSSAARRWSRAGGRAPSRRR